MMHLILVQLYTIGPSASQICFVVMYRAIWASCNDAKQLIAPLEIISRVEIISRGAISLYHYGRFKSTSYWLKKLN